jgi:hypothetical protein
MPRIKMVFEDQPRRADGKLVERLADELKADRESGQPFIYEQSFPTGKVRVLVIWDDWADLPLEERTNIILSAVEKSDGRDYRAKVALASGLTVPEGVAAGMLPHQIIPARRKADKVTLEQCREAMLAEGASRLFGPNALQLRFPTEEAAEACRMRLIKRLPNSDEIWIVSREITAQDFGQGSESVALGPG